MKISFNPSVSYFQAQKAENKKQVTTNPNQNHNEIQKNSMAELLGRCQTVSFGATNKMAINNGISAMAAKTLIFILTHLRNDGYDDETPQWLHPNLLC